MSLLEAFYGIPNNIIVAKGKGFAVSYNPIAGYGIEEKTQEETALILNDFPHGMDGHSWTGTAYFILKGDFREEYKALVNEGRTGLGMLYGFYRQHRQKYGSRWSTDFHEWGKDGRKRKPGEILAD